MIAERMTYVYYFHLPHGITITVSSVLYAQIYSVFANI